MVDMGEMSDEWRAAPGMVFQVTEPEIRKSALLVGCYTLGKVGGKVFRKARKARGVIARSRYWWALRDGFRAAGEGDKMTLDESQVNEVLMSFFRGGSLGDWSMVRPARPRPRPDR